MKKVFEFKCITVRGGRHYHTIAKVEVELTNDNVFSASAHLEWSGKWFGLGGQCLDELNEIVKDKKFKTIYEMWKKHHLNNMHPGTEAQEKALNEAGLTGWASTYEQCCEYLKSVGLYEDNGYKFGTGWLKREIPQEDLETIKGLLN